MKNSILFFKKHFLCVSLFLIPQLNTVGQELNKNSPPEVIKLINEANDFYSVNDELINGCVYPLPNSRIKNHPYLNDQWTETTIFIKNKTYTNLLTKYDLIIDDVILKVKLEDDIEKLINLNKFQVDSLYFSNSMFLNSNTFLTYSKEVGYFEKIYKDKFALLKKYKKVFIKEYNNITPYGKYSNSRIDLYLFDGEQLHSVNNKKSFLKCFDKEIQNEIKLFMKRNKINYKRATNQQLNDVMNFSTALINK